MTNNPIKQETDLKTLEINVLSKEQYEQERDNGNLTPNAFYLTPDDKELFKAGQVADSVVRIVTPNPDNPLAQPTAGRCRAVAELGCQRFHKTGSAQIVIE